MPKRKRAERKRVSLAGETEPEPEPGEEIKPPIVEISTDEMAKRLPPSKRVMYETTKRIFLTILSRISDVIVSRDLTDKIMMKYHLFKDSPEEEDRLIREEIDKYEQTGKRIYTKFLGKVADVSHVESLTDNIMKKYHLFKDSPEEEDRLIRKEIDKYKETVSKSAHESARELIESHILSTGDPSPTINPGEGESVFGVPQVAPPQVGPETQAFNDLRDYLSELPPDDILELQSEDPDELPNPFGDARGAALKTKRSKKRKKSKKSKRRKYKKSKRRKNKKTKRR